MYRKIVLSLIFATIWYTTPVVAHEMTPTYPEFTASHVDGVLKTTVNMFNRRADVAYFEIEVYDEEWYAIPFVSTSALIHLEYLKHATVDIYVKADDAKRATYVCSISRLYGNKNGQSLLASKICSKIKHSRF